MRSDHDSKHAHSFFQSTIHFNLDEADGNVPFDFMKYDIFSKTNDFRDAAHALDTTSNEAPLRQHLIGILLN